MLQGDGGPLDVVYIVMKALIAIGLWGAASIGHFQHRLAWWERLFAMGAAFSLVAALPATDEIGFALTAMFIGQHWWRHRVPAGAAPG